MRRLYDNNIGPEGAKAVADALRVNGSLTKLDAGYNRLGNEGVAALQRAVEGRAGFELKLSVSYSRGYSVFMNL